MSLQDIKGEVCGTDQWKGGAGDLGLWAEHCLSISCVGSPL